MASKRQVAANRRNAQRSTGPKTPEGKSLSAANALHDGLHASQHLVLPSWGESASAFETHCAAFEAEFAPVGPFERELVKSISSLVWRLRRIPRLETAASLPAADLPPTPDGIQPYNSLRLEPIAPDAPVAQRLARMRADLQYSQNRCLNLEDALKRLNDRLRPWPEDGEDSMAEYMDLQEAVSCTNGSLGHDPELWDRLGAEVPSESPDRPGRWSASRMARAFDLLARESGLTLRQYFNRVRKQLRALIDLHAVRVVERQAQESELATLVQAERDRASVVRSYSAEDAIARVQKSEQHLMRQLERNMSLLNRVQTERASRPPQREHLRCFPPELPAIGFVFTSRPLPSSDAIPLPVAERNSLSASLDTAPLELETVTEAAS